MNDDIYKSIIELTERIKEVVSEENTENLVKEFNFVVDSVEKRRTQLTDLENKLSAFKTDDERVQQNLENLLKITKRLIKNFADMIAILDNLKAHIDGCFNNKDVFIAGCADLHKSIRESQQNNQHGSKEESPQVKSGGGLFSRVKRMLSR